MAAALAGLALLLAACPGTSTGTGVASIGSTSTTTPGSSGGGPGTGSRRTAKAPGLLAFSPCLRRHGLAAFPEPDASGNIQIHAEPGSDLSS